jgi:hypothetical protein
VNNARFLGQMSRLLIMPLLPLELPEFGGCWQRCKGKARHGGS